MSRTSITRKFKMLWFPKIVNRYKYAPSLPDGDKNFNGSLVAFDEGERFLMQSTSTFLEFLRGIHRYKFGLPKKIFRGEIIQGEWRNFHRARALFLTGVEFHVLPCVLVFFLVEIDLLFAFSLLSLDCASLFIYDVKYIWNNSYIWTAVVDQSEEWSSQ